MKMPVACRLLLLTLPSLAASATPAAAVLLDVSAEPLLPFSRAAEPAEAMLPVWAGAVAVAAVVAATAAPDADEDDDDDEEEEEDKEEEEEEEDGEDVDDEGCGVEAFSTGVACVGGGKGRGWPPLRSSSGALPRPPPPPDRHRAAASSASDLRCMSCSTSCRLRRLRALIEV